MQQVYLPPIFYLIALAIGVLHITLLIVFIHTLGKLGGRQMSSKELHDALSQLKGHVNTLAEKHANSVPQAEVDAATAIVRTLDERVQVAIATNAPPAPAS